MFCVGLLWYDLVVIEGDKCGGNFKFTDKGFKDCTDCQLPHKRKNYGYVTGKYAELVELMKKMG